MEKYSKPHLHPGHNPSCSSKCSAYWSGHPLGVAFTSRDPNFVCNNKC